LKPASLQKDSVFIQITLVSTINGFQGEPVSCLCQFLKNVIRKVQIR
jgi:hypothetical protein